MAEAPKCLMSDANAHPVWEVYDLQRTCRLSYKYWARKLIVLRRLNFWMEYSMLVTAPGSAVAGYVVWRTDSGEIAWTLLTALTALIGIAKPLLKLSDHLEALLKVVTGYRSIDFQFEELCCDIRREKSYTPEMVQSLKRLHKQIQEVTRDEPVEGVDEDLRQQCFQAVNRELPAGSFWLPQDITKGNQPEPPLK